MTRGKYANKAEAQSARDEALVRAEKLTRELSAVRKGAREMEEALRKDLAQARQVNARLRELQAQGTSEPVEALRQELAEERAAREVDMRALLRGVEGLMYEHGVQIPKESAAKFTTALGDLFGVSGIRMDSESRYMRRLMQHKPKLVNELGRQVGARRLAGLPELNS